MNQVLLPEALVQRIRSYVNSRPLDVEQGGLLLGLRKSAAIEVSSVTFPQPWDVASSLRFHRSERGHQEKAVEEWKKSGKIVDWIGEWHTHPLGEAFPSSIDQKMWVDIVRHTSQPMVFLILGANSIFVGRQNVDAHAVKRLSARYCDAGYVLYSP